jgi:3'-phosphoadenosine 5'-phosphosulfate sulfotransferase (PAPS reductase)/FAD synthetase
VNEYDFNLNDRITKIKSMNEYDFNLNGFISFSGGKDSTVLHYLMDLALPGNKIPRVYFNTGIEYKSVLSYVRGLAEKDDRIIIVNSGVNIKSMLEEFGYPFKSKEHSQKVSYYQKSGMTKTVINYLGKGTKKDFLCSKRLIYNFSTDFKIKVSDKCCYKLKKEPAEKWGKENKRPITITGVRQSEKGLRQSMKGCAVFYDDNCKQLKKFHPLFPCDDNFINEFIKRNNIKLCELYYPPYSFERTGCKGCPYSLDLQEQLETMALFFPAEKKQCEVLWQKVYAEYRRIGYRLTGQPTLFD